MWASAGSGLGSGLWETGGERRVCRPLHHHHGSRIGVLKPELDGALLDGTERVTAVTLQLKRLVGVLDFLFLFLQARGLVAEPDYLEVLPCEEEQERADGNAERKDSQQLTGAAAVAFANDVGVFDGLLLRVHAGTDPGKLTEAGKKGEGLPTSTTLETFTPNHRPPATPTPLPRRTQAH